MNYLDPRAEALRILQSVTDESSDRTADWSAPEGLAPLDQALFHEITHGIFREFKFLEFIIGRYASKKPRLKARNLLLLGAYQLLFLEKVPAYAVFAELKKLVAHEKFSIEEGKFLHGVLKAVERDRDTLLASYGLALREISEGRYPSEPIGTSVLNLDGTVIDSMKKAVLAQGHKSSMLWKSLARFKERPPLVGYVWPLREFIADGIKTLGSSLAPQGIVFENGQVMRGALAQRAVRIQGEASQWACQVASQFLRQRENSSVLEIASGKGGKLFGTIAALENSKTAGAKGLTWIASDNSLRQIELLEASPLDSITSCGVKVETLVWDWTREGSPEMPVHEFDLVWVDAPCSGLGTLAKHPEIAWRVNNKTLEKRAALQLKLLLKSWPLVKKGGGLFYTLCTLSYEETFGVIEQFIAQHPEAQVIDKQFLWPANPELITPEGFFGVMFLR